MSEKEDKQQSTPTSHNNEDIDIYSDILSDRPESVAKLKQTVEKLLSEKTLLLKSLNGLQENYEQMLKKFKELDAKYKTICLNSSSLYKTAKSEIARKDRMIQELRRERDNLVFRKTPTVQVLGRARKMLRTPNKSRSPFKKTEPEDEDLLEKTHFGEDYVEEEENNLLSIGPKKSQEEEPENIESNVARNYDMNDGLISSSTKTNCNIPPPVHGPITAYTKRMYKKNYGVSPPNSPSAADHSCRIKQNIISDICKAGSTLSSEIVEKGSPRISTKQEVVTSGMTSKLQDQGKEFIKLGSKPTTPTAKSSLSPTTKSPKNQNNKMLDFDRNKVLNETQPTFILQCDLRTPKNTDEAVNTVSVNETIDNIIRNQKAGLYDKKQSIESKGAGTDAKIPLEIIRLASTSSKTTKLITRENFNNLKSIRGNQSSTPMTKTLETAGPHRLVAGLNKRVTSNKPAISPVTFGKLVAPETGAPGRSAPAASTSDTVHCGETETRKNKVLTALFGESPMKPILNDEVDEMSPSPTSQFDFQILPSSPSIDSDNPEDLVIDTMAGSQNTSPRVSESSQKDEGERVEILQSKLPETCCDNGPEELSLNERKGNACSNVEGKINMERLHFGHNEATENCSNVKKAQLQNLNKKFPEFEAVKTGELCLPDLSECFSLDGNQLSANFTEKPAAISIISHNPESKTSSQELHIEPTNVLPQKQNPQMNRFIPSPPQLTLVSAFKHSENSVFSIAEDTVGFVSALTRIRDISPLRTPNKKRKNSSTETQGQDTDTNNKSETELGIKEQQLNTTLSLSSIKPTDVGSDDKNSDEAMSITFQTANKGMSCESVEKERKPLASITNPNIEPSEQSKLENLNSNKKEPQSGNCSRENGGAVAQESVFGKTNKSPFCSVFKRSRPVRRIIPIPNKPEVVSKITKETVCVKSVETNTSIVAEVQCSEESRKPTTIGTADDELGLIPDNHTINIGNTSKSNHMCAEEVKPTIKNHNLNVPDKSTPYIDSNKIKTTQQSPNNLKNTIFKRSESLRMMPKPVAKVTYDTLSYNKIEISQKIVHRSVQLASQETEKKELVHRSVQLATRETEKKELEQIPHIASINKKKRVSNYQGNVEKTKPQEVVRTSKETINKECKTKDQIVLPPASDRRSTAIELHPKQRRSTDFKSELAQQSKSILQDPPNNLREPLKINKNTNEIVDKTFFNSKKVLQNNWPKKTQRSKSSHCVQRSHSRSPDPIKSVYHSRKTHSRSPDSNKTAHFPGKSQNRSPEARYRLTSHHRSRKSNEEIPDASYRPTSHHRSRKSCEESPDANYRPTSHHRSRKSCEESPDASYRPTSHHRSRKSCEESTDPRIRKKSQHRLRRSPSLSPEGNHPKSIHRSRRSQSRSPHTGYRTKSHNRSRRSHSRSPGYYYRNKFDHCPRRSSSGSPDYSRLTKSYHSRRHSSRSPVFRDVREPISTFKNRNPYEMLPHGHYMKRLRSRSPSPNESIKNSVHYYSRRSNGSPHRSRRKVERSQSPPYAKGPSFNNRKDYTSEHAVNNEQNQSSHVQDCPDEIARLRKELELMKSKLKDSLAVNNSPTAQETPSHKTSSLDVSVDKSLDPPNDKLEIAKGIGLDCTGSEEQADCINGTNETSGRIASEGCKRSSSTSIKEMVTSSLETDDGEGEGVTLPPVKNEPKKQKSEQEVIKVIRLTRRRVGHLGDSDVNVVSSTSKFSSKTKVVTP